MEKWCFLDNKEESDYLFELVKVGVKTATSYLFIDNKQLLNENPVSILTNWDKTEELKINTTKIYKCKFKEISKEHAFKEGEGDKTLKHWKKVHKKFFIKECERLNKKFSEGIEIVCEEFEILK